ncbi:MAG: NAD(P)/FAD-dependent oxidoreductase [Desulfuromonadales bacterium]|nr:NAD(P)/FAD-dependent oxidoreductase [Desulfuromonadales bacterium]MBN2793288.1 NAD(P)/FAD-dependent oxidoreductase [Desulfuromonadales bacterium]
MAFSHDIIILGAGTTAFAGARIAAAAGKKVLMVEQSHLGGTCVNWGCVPSKTLIHKAEMYHAARKGERWGLNLRAGEPDCGTLMPLKRQAVETIRTSHYQRELDHTENLSLVQGHGCFIAPDSIKVGQQTYSAPQILIASGGEPRVVPIPGLDTIKYLTSYSALHLPCFPQSVIILGGGVIALEMGQMFARFGTSVTILERGPQLLAEFDPRLTEQFRAMLELEGVKILCNVEAQRVEKRAEAVSLYALINGAEVGFTAERLMLAIGTQPATREIGLEAIGVETDDNGFIRVDNQLRTTVPGIWAAGDVTGQPLIAPAGAREAQIAVQNMLEPDAEYTIDHRFSPMAVFVDPEFATVGLTRKQAELQGYEVVTTYLHLDRIPKAHVMGDFLGGVLLSAEKGTGKILGVQMLCPRAADIIHEATLAIRFNLSVVDLTTTVHVYPSISDGLRQAARENAFQQGLI